jgi:DNA-binding transcriptional MerR regulator
MTLAELADASGLPARTIRFYISRGLLSGPVKAGREAEYTERHLERIERIKRLQAEGRPLSQVAHVLNGPELKNAPPQPAAWLQYAIAKDVVVWVRAGKSPWATKNLGGLIGDFAGAVRRLEKEGSGKPENE